MKVQERIEPTIESSGLKRAFKTKRILQYTRKVIVLREVSTPRYSASKKSQALDVAQRIKKRKHDKFEASFEKVLMETEDDSESNGFDTRVMDTFQSSP